MISRIKQHLHYIFSDEMPESAKSVEQTKTFTPASLHDLMPLYWRGRRNFFVRMYVYARYGMEMLNEFKYYFAAGIALYAIVRNPALILALLAMGVPFLIILGRWNLERVSKPQSYISTMLGSPLGYNDYNNQVRQVQLLEEILKKLDYENQRHY